MKEVTLSKIRKALPEAAVKELCQLYELLDGGMNRGDVDADAVSVKPDEKADIEVREMSVFRKMAEIAEKNRSSCAMDALLRFGNSINGRREKKKKERQEK